MFFFNNFYSISSSVLYHDHLKILSITGKTTSINESFFHI